MAALEWTKIESGSTLIIYHSVFKKMHILKIYECKKDTIYFVGCFILNLEISNKKYLSDYHFYTTKLFLGESVWRMCIQPHPLLSNQYKEDKFEDIDRRIISWYSNCHIIASKGIDVLGQRHGKNVSEKYKLLKSGVTWEQANQIVDKKLTTSEKIQEFKDMLEHHKNNLLLAIKISKSETIMNIIFNSKRYSIKEIFS